MRTRDVFRKATKLLENGWTQHAFARNASGSIVHVLAPGARYFCARGALTRASLGDARALLAAKIKLAKCLPNHNHLITIWNDAPGRTQDEVLAMFRKLSR